MAKRKRELTDDEILANGRAYTGTLMKAVEDRIFATGAHYNMDNEAIAQAERDGALNILKSSFENRFKPADLWHTEVIDSAIKKAQEAYHERVHENFERAAAHEKSEHEMYERGMAKINGTSQETDFVSVGPEGDKHAIPVSWLTK